METPPNKRMLWLDAVKGFSIISIMISHSCGIPIIGKYFVAGFVSIWFVLSGFTIREESLLVGVGKKFRSLIIPYFFYGLLCVAALSIRHFILSGYDTRYTLNFLWGLIYSRYSLYSPLICVDNNFFFMRAGIEPLWFLTCLFLSFIWTYFYLGNSRKDRLVLLIVYLIIPILCEKLPILLPWSFDTSFLGSIFMIIGYHFKNIFINKQIALYYSPIKSWIIFLFFIILLIIVVNEFGAGNFSIGYYGDCGVLSYVAFISIGIIKTILLCFFFIIMEKTMLSKCLASVGKQSLRLMCLHLAVFVFVGVVDKSPTMTILSFFILSVIGVLISYFLSLLFGKLQILNIDNRVLKYL